MYFVFSYLAIREDAEDILSSIKLISNTTIVIVRSSKPQISLIFENLRDQGYYKSVNNMSDQNNSVQSLQRPIIDST